MDVGKEAYTAYCVEVGGKSAVTGSALPPWENLPTEIQRAWVVSANAVVDYVAGIVAVNVADALSPFLFPPGKTE